VCLLVLHDEVVGDFFPLHDGGNVHLEECLIEQQLHRLSLPSLSSVLVFGQGCQDFGGGPEARLVGDGVVAKVGKNVQQHCADNRKNLIKIEIYQF